ncbi:AAA family ATPase [Bernardetia sp. Wsw4-3y2]|uniref:AAA family ATPase n=1 Tax=Bernardetia sp. Wsw4-3y2 TaxID=3127471 RepID=UPI0030CEA581
MKLNIKNLGALKEAEIDLSKDLILLCGHNNTGKTYVAYAIYYALDKNIAPLFHLDNNKLIFVSTTNSKGKAIAVDFPALNDTDKIVKTLQTRNEIRVNLEDLYEEIIPVLLPIYEKNYLEVQRHLFSFSEFMHNRGFENTILYPQYSKEEIKQRLHSKEIDKNKSWLYGFRSEKNADEYEANLSYFRTEDNEKFSIRGHIFDMVFSKNLKISNDTYIFTSERSAINNFSQDLSLKGFEDIEGISASSQLLSKKDKIESRKHSYPIIDSIKIAENQKHFSQFTSEFEFLAIELEQNILEGKISVGQYGGLQYQPQNTSKNIVLEIAQASSLVQSLSPIVFYLRHLAEKNDCIIIDEPELNLHPDNQILVARFLARLVNEGFKVVASTHSDYVIRELSNLLMLSNSFGEKEELMKTYRYNENELLKNEQVGVYYFEKGKNTAVSVPLLKRGIEIDSINEVITDLNERSDNIYYTFLESDENKAAEKEEENLKNNSKI